MATLTAPVAPTPPTRSLAASLHTGIGRHLAALLVLVLGSGSVFAAMVLLNRIATLPKRASSGSAVEFQTAPPRPPPRTQRTTPPTPRRTTRADPIDAPTPALGSASDAFDAGIPLLPPIDMPDIASSLVGSTGVAVMTESTVDTPPQASAPVAPVFPQAARQRGITGYVTFNLLIGLNGEVERAVIVEASPVGVFEDAAATAIQAWRFSPARYQGQTVRAWAKQTIRFNLD